MGLSFECNLAPASLGSRSMQADQRRVSLVRLQGPSLAILVPRAFSLAR